MARRFQIDAAITADIKSVATDSFKDNIRMIEIEKIKPSLDNFYSLSDIEMLADDIERQGLKHNMVVVEDSDNPNTFFIKSGHRRYTAIQYLVSENRYTSKYVPCLVDGVKTHSENILDLIMLNATTRVMTDAELFKQYEVLKETLEQLKREGKKVKGRLRENVAAFLNVSPAQVGKIENIKHNAVNEIITAVECGDMTIATADSIAKLSEEEQTDILAEIPIKEISAKELKERKQKKTNPRQNKDIEPTMTDDEILKMELSEDFCQKESYEANEETASFDSGKNKANLETSIEENATEESVKKEMMLLKWAQSLSKEQISYLLDGGWYNNAIKGYLITAAKNADIDKERIYELLDELNAAFSDYTKDEAEQLYINY